MRKKPTDGYKDRLALALRRGPRPMSVRGLHAAMQARFPGQRGTSYGGIRHYAEGKPRNPRVELLRAMADVLGVRGDWLAFGDGEMTEEAERIRAAAEGRMPSPKERPLDFIWTRIDVPFPEFEELPADLQTLVLIAVQRFNRAAALGLGSVHPDWFNAFLMTLRQTTIAPLRSWYGEKYDLSEPRTQDYVRAVLSAFIAAIPPRLDRPPEHISIGVSWLPEDESVSAPSSDEEED